MIAKLYGRIDETGVDHLVIDVNGVGYLVQASARARLHQITNAVDVNHQMVNARFVNPAIKLCNHRCGLAVRFEIGKQKRTSWEQEGFFSAGTGQSLT